LKPPALIYCQHSLGLGHFVRSLALARGLATQFDLTFVNGGPLPEGQELPADIDFQHLPPLRMRESGLLEGDGDVDKIFAERRARLLNIDEALKPSLLIVELYPFGRKKFAVEIDPLIAAVRSRDGKIVCSVRDVLVNGRVDQARHDERAALRLNAQFDMVLVHSDERIFALEESFRPETAIAIPIRYTGFVVQKRASTSHVPAAGATLVTAGGGAVGRALYEAALDAQSELWDRRRWPMTIVAGPLFPETDWIDLQARSEGVPGLTLHRAVPDMNVHLSSADRVISQCGYNSALEIVRAGVPALYVPFARGRESEQTMRAMRFKALGLCDWVAEEGLDGPKLAHRLAALQHSARRENLSFDGAIVSAQLLTELVA
jgi:predicted glycosyltransferase